MSTPHVVIVGGGFGGVYTARFLAPYVKSGSVKVTLLNRNNFFLFTPLLHEVAAGSLTSTSVIEPIREIFRDECIRFIQTEVTGIDTKMKRVITTTGSVPYDFLVLSQGADTNFYGVTGAKENSLTLKNLSDAINIRKRIVDSLEKASNSTDGEERKKLLSLIVVGGGPSSIELIAELSEFMHESRKIYFKHTNIEKKEMSVTLVSSSSEILGQFPGGIGKIAHRTLAKKGIRIITSATVTAVSDGKVALADGTTLVGGHIVWAAGVTPNTLSKENFTLDKGNRVVVNQFLQAQGHENVFCLGDVACFMADPKDTHPLAMLAQVAAQQAKTVAINIPRSIRNKPLTPFIYKQKGLLVSLGKWNAAGTIYGYTFSGKIMWWVWRTVYLFNFHSWSKRVKIAVEWTVHLFRNRDISQTLS